MKDNINKRFLEMMNMDHDEDVKSKPINEVKYGYF